MAFKVEVGPRQIAIHHGQTVLVTEPDKATSVCVPATLDSRQHPP